MCQPATTAPVGVPFEAVLPVIVITAKRSFRDIRCPQTRDDAIAEVVAIAWVRFRLTPSAFARPIAVERFACDCAEAVREGCRFADLAN